MIHRHLADNTNEKSLAAKLRRRRFQILLNMLVGLPRPVTILDIGGAQAYWEMMGTELFQAGEINVTLLNIDIQPVSLPGFTAIAGDGRALPQFSDQQFEVVFSNSTIEHVGDLEDQRRMAAEVRRVGQRYYIQTPNRYFPIEPHFVFPCFQFLPVSLRVWLLQRFNLGWYQKVPDHQQALKAVRGIRLLTRTELKQLFPGAIIFEERFLGLVKSFVAYNALGEPKA